MQLDIHTYVHTSVIQFLRIEVLLIRSYVQLKTLETLSEQKVSITMHSMHKISVGCDLILYILARSVHIRMYIHHSDTKDPL